jgi:hypothetical protein
MSYDEAFRWLVSQEQTVMSDTRAKTIMSFARDAGRAPASDTEWLEYLEGEGYSTRRDPVGVRRFQEHARDQRGAGDPSRRCTCGHGQDVHDAGVGICDDCYCDAFRAAPPESERGL